MPLAGALADQLGRRKPFLIAFTLVAAGSCALLEVIPADGNVLPLLVAAGIAVAFGQLALAQYDPLLADVAPRGRRGRLSGIAVAFGFIGIFFALAVVAEGIVGDGSKQQAFAPAGALFVLFALPAFFWIRERRHEPSTATRPEGGASSGTPSGRSCARRSRYAPTGTRFSSSSAASSTRTRSRRCRRSSPCT